MIDVQHSLILIAVMSVLTMAIKFLPFIIFPGGKETPAVISYLGKVLPPAMIAMLVVYCLKNVDLLSGSRGLPEAMAIAATTALHLLKRQMLLSIAGGTAVYMLLVQLIF